LTVEPVELRDLSKTGNHLVLVMKGTQRTERMTAYFYVLQTEQTGCQCHASEKDNGARGRVEQ